MAEHVERMDREDEFEFVGFRLSWGAIFAGLVVALVTQIILSLIGLAVGLGTIDFRAGQSVESVGIGAGVWAVVSALISLFVGGLVAGHLAGVLSRTDGMLHGVLVWGLSMIIGLYTLTAGVSSLVGGAFGIAGQAVASAAGGAVQVGARQLQQTGMPQMPEDTSAQQQIVAILQQQGMSQQQAQRAASEIQQTRTQVQLQAEQVRRQAPQVATQAAETVSTAIWWILLAALLSLAAAAGGAAITARS